MIIKKILKRIIFPKYTKWEVLDVQKLDNEKFTLTQSRENIHTGYKYFKTSYISESNLSSNEMLKRIDDLECNCFRKKENE